MRNTFRRTLIVGALWTALSLPLAATTIYDNSANDTLTRFYAAPNLEIGDQIILSGTERLMTGFSFEYFGQNPVLGTSFEGPVSAKLRFYAMDGPTFNGQTSPGTLLFTSDWVALD